MLLDALKEIVSHTANLGFIDLVKITGTDSTTELNAIAEDRSVVIQSKFNTALPEFKGTFGMPNLNKLNVILNIPEYKENAAITVLTQTHNGATVPSAIAFANAAGDFRNEYRLMNEQMINSKLPVAKFKEPQWEVEFVPSAASVLKLKFQSQANTDEKNFQVTTDKNQNLQFAFGDHSTHAGKFVFEPAVTGTLKQAWSYPIAQTQAVLNLSGDKKIKVSNAGTMMITVDSGLAIYEFIFLALIK